VEKEPQNAILDIGTAVRELAGIIDCEYDFMARDNGVELGFAIGAIFLDKLRKILHKRSEITTHRAFSCVHRSSL
jgi:hypothetical protein